MKFKIETAELNQKLDTLADMVIIAGALIVMAAYIYLLAKDSRHGSTNGSHEGPKLEGTATLNGTNLIAEAE